MGPTEPRTRLSPSTEIPTLAHPLDIHTAIAPLRPLLIGTYSLSWALKKARVVALDPIQRPRVAFALLVEDGRDDSACL